MIYYTINVIFKYLLGNRKKTIMMNIVIKYSENGGEINQLTKQLEDYEQRKSNEVGSKRLIDLCRVRGITNKEHTEGDETRKGQLETQLMHSDVVMVMKCDGC